MSPLPPYIDVVLILAAIASALIGFQRWTFRRQRPQAVTGALLMWSGSLWILSNTLQLMSTDPQVKLLWTRIQFVGIIPVPFLWFFLAMQFTGLDRLFTWRRIVALSVPPVVLLALLMTDPFHHLVIADARTVDRGTFQVLEIDYGPALWSYFVYGHSQVILGTLILAWRVVRTPGFRWQGSALLLGVVLTVIANAADVLKLGPRVGFELTPFALLVCVPLFVFALVRFQRADLLPVARGKVLEDMRDGLVVLDAQDRILDLNPSATTILGRSLREAERGSVLRTCGRSRLTWPTKNRRIHPLCSKSAADSRTVRGSSTSARPSFAIGEAKSQDAYWHSVTLPHAWKPNDPCGRARNVCAGCSRTRRSGSTRRPPTDTSCSPIRHWRTCLALRLPRR